MKLSMVFAAAVFAVGCGSSNGTHADGKGNQDKKGDGGLVLPNNVNSSGGCVTSDTIGCAVVTSDGGSSGSSSGSNGSSSGNVSSSGGSSSGDTSSSGGSSGSSSGNVGDDGSVATDDGGSSSGGSSGSSSGSVGDDATAGDDGSVVVVDGGQPGDDGSTVADVVAPPVDSGTGDDVVAPPVDSGNVSDGGQTVDTGVAPVCTKTRGWYANHTNWPLVPITLGNTTYSEAQGLALLALPSHADDSLILGMQALTAIENGGNNDPFIAPTIAAAQAWLSNNGTTLPYGFMDNSADPVSVAATTLATALDAWNNGLDDVPACK